MTAQLVDRLAGTKFKSPIVNRQDFEKTMVRLFGWSKKDLMWNAEHSEYRNQRVDDFWHGWCLRSAFTEEYFAARRPAPNPPAAPGEGM